MKGLSGHPPRIAFCFSASSLLLLAPFWRSGARGWVCCRPERRQARFKGGEKLLCAVVSFSLWLLHSARGLPVATRFRVSFSPWLPQPVFSAASACISFWPIGRACARWLLPAFTALFSTVCSLLDFGLAGYSYWLSALNWFSLKAGAVSSPAHGFRIVS